MIISEWVHTLRFPTKQLHVLCIALAANGTSSYRDATNLARLCHAQWGAHVTIVSDRPIVTTVAHVIVISSAAALLTGIRTTVRHAAKTNSDLLFTISAHGYSTVVPDRRMYELNGRTEYISVNTERVYDYELFAAFYDDMPNDTVSVCLIDTCHSGTMLDLEYISYDGGHTCQRSKTPLRQRPHSICISACNDNELAGEDVGQFGGWGGKLTCHFTDYVNTHDLFDVVAFYKQIYTAFTEQREQASHPLLSYNE